MTTTRTKVCEKPSYTFYRGGRLSDEQFYASMAVDVATPLWVGFMEALDRAEDQVWDENRNADLTREIRADLGLRAGVIREIREQLYAAREIGMKKISG